MSAQGRDLPPVRPSAVCGLCGNAPCICNDAKPYTREEMEALDLSDPNEHGGWCNITIWNNDGQRSARPQCDCIVGRAIVTALAGLADRDRIDWLEQTVVREDATPPAEYDDDAQVWRHDDGRTFASFRETLDVLMAESVPQRSGQRSPFCEVRPASSAMCARGTKGCEVSHDAGER